MEIRTITGSIIYDSETAKNVKELIEESLKSGANLRGADLRCADLSGAHLRGADLSDAYLRGADLRGADISGAYLRCANLRGANLRGADLSEADLRGADLKSADLKSANLKSADLSGAHLGGADLCSANLRGAYLRFANLRGADLGVAILIDANLRSADIKSADLRGADLRGADLSGAYLSGADLSDANLRGAENIPYIPIACPTDGEFTAWKKVGECLIRLMIPADAKRISATTNKCRCDKALVLSITNIEETKSFSEVFNNKYAATTYKVGEMVYPDSFNDNRWEECSHGIHFFINKQDAINY